MYLAIRKAERKTKTKKTATGRKSQHTQSQIEETHNEVSEVSEDESLVIE